MQALWERLPQLEIMVRTDRPSWLFPPTATVFPIGVDVGMVQKDSLTLLVDQTVRCARAFEERRRSLAEAEARALAPLQPSIVVSDIPPLAFDVAGLLGVPSVAVGNFSWDWIYAHAGAAPYEVEPIVASIGASESQASMLLRLPLHGDMSAFPHIEDAPFIASVSTADPGVTRQQLGVPHGRAVVLLSFGGFELERMDYAALGALTDMTFVIPGSVQATLPPNVVTGPRDPGVYQDLLAACDVVVMKPGYGTVADCLANRVPMVYTTRPGFKEQEILVPGMHSLGRAVHIEQEDLLAGRLRPAIDAARALDHPWQPLAFDGADVVANRILEIADLQPRN
jgi:L-arabinokinase